MQVEYLDHISNLLTAIIELLDIVDFVSGSFMDFLFLAGNSEQPSLPFPGYQSLLFR